MRTYKGPIFQHRHYAAIAKTMADTMASGMIATYDWEHMREKFVTMFQSDNPRFDQDRFIAACKGKPINGRDKR